MTIPTPQPNPYPAPSAPPADGAALTFETVGTTAPTRMRPEHWTLLRVIDGVVRLTEGNVERLLHPGDEAVVEPGRPHRIAAATGRAVYVFGLRSTPLR